MLVWGRNATLPGNHGVPVIDVLVFLGAGIGNGKIWRESKGLAFSFVMALPPLLIFMLTLIAFLPFNGLQDELLYQLQDMLPSSVYNPLADTINDVMGHKHTSMLSIGFVLAIIFAANSMHGMMMYFSTRSENTGMERRRFPKRYAICIGLVFLLYLMVVVALVLLIGYKFILMWLFHHGWLVPGSLTHWIISVGRWIIIIFMGMLTITTIYYVIPTKKFRVGFFSIGAVFALGMFILLSFGFRWWLANFNQYNLLYGSIGTVLVIMLWLFLNSLVLMLGYELNVAIIDGSVRGSNARLQKRINNKQ